MLFWLLAISILAYGSLSFSFAKMIYALLQGMFCLNSN